MISVAGFDDLRNLIFLKSKGSFLKLLRHRAGGEGIAVGVIGNARILTLGGDKLIEPCLARGGGADGGKLRLNFICTLFLFGKLLLRKLRAGFVNGGDKDMLYSDISQIRRDLI